jgi:hypothetical protein
VQTDQTLVRDLVATYKALGGGWDGAGDVAAEASSPSAASGHSWRGGRHENVPIASR